ncbi:hypothetical protein [Aequorivita viscosa]|uniref:hypothetical protein n=1 Tax=Aequorivita viscosa TaxID=797419 RepID=UPI00135644D8|nr:hypothetical protein [Aequorivita viscosa]
MKKFSNPFLKPSDVGLEKERNILSNPSKNNTTEKRIKFPTNKYKNGLIKLCP